MKIKNIQELKSRKEELKADIQEMESVLSFRNPRKTLGVVTDGLSEKHLGNVLNSKLVYKVLPLAGAFLGNTLQARARNLAVDMAKKHLTKSFLTKGGIGLGLLLATPFLVRKLKKEFDEYQKRETAKSLSKLI